MILEKYLKQNDLNIRQLHLITNIPESTLRSLNNRDISKWNMEYFESISKAIHKPKIEVITELEGLKESNSNKTNKLMGKYNLENRRYIGAKNKLSSWIKKLILDNTEGKSFFDVFAGTGIMTKTMIDCYDDFIINDFLFSNEVIYHAFFGNEIFDVDKILEKTSKFQELKAYKIEDNYFSNNFSGKYFSNNDSKLIGHIRLLIRQDSQLSYREKSILLSSLIYSADKIANTVGHYDAYRKKIDIEDKFKFELISPIDTKNKNIEIFRKDSNSLVRSIKSDIAFIDPPYNSRQYSRFYHVLENLTKWDEPELSGTALKPKSENMSDYCRTSAPQVFDDLIKSLNTKYIVVTYNNTYKSKSSSSRNKITHSQILESLNSVGETKIFEKEYRFFNTGKTNLNEHKEFVFITKVGV